MKTARTPWCKRPCPSTGSPDFTRYIVQRLKTLCPTLGKVKIAQTLARAGVHLSTSTVGRMLKRKRRPKTPTIDSEDFNTLGKNPTITARHPNHTWHVDLTVVPTNGGFWTSWFPFSMPQCWPFCYWVAIVADHFSRRIMGATAFTKQPTSADVQDFLGQAVTRVKRDKQYKASCAHVVQKKNRPKRWKSVPKYIICDRGKQFDCKSFRKWCQRKNIQPPRYGAIGKHGSIAVVERLILTMKTILLCLLRPLNRDAFQSQLDELVEWYNEHRPHTWLGGRTPNEVYYGRFPANRKPRFEPRSHWPRGSPWALTRGSPGAKLALEVSFHNGNRHLPIVKVKRAA